MRTPLRTTLTCTMITGCLLATTGAGHGASRAASTGSWTPVRAVAALVGPMATPGSQAACQVISGEVEACPITSRLRYRLAHYQRDENGNIVSRAQNAPRAIRYAQGASNSFVARVDTRWVYGASEAYTITFVVVRQDDGWRVDDAYCAGRPATSIYNPPVGPCR